MNWNASATDWTKCSSRMTVMVLSSVPVHPGFVRHDAVGRGDGHRRQQLVAFVHGPFDAGRFQAAERAVAIRGVISRRRILAFRVRGKSRARYTTFGALYDARCSRP